MMQQNKGNSGKNKKTIGKIRQAWDRFAHTYSSIDNTINTTFYSLVNMIELPKAKHILQVGCGSGKLIPLVLELKPQQATYLASDLSPIMINIAKEGIEKYVLKMGVQKKPDAWMISHNLTLMVSNAEEKIESSFKFDRIIANLVLHITENPIKMLTNLYEMAEDGCLLAVSIIGKEELNDLRCYLPEAYQAKGQAMHLQNQSFLFGKLREIGEKTGWETIVQWQQNTPFIFQGDEMMKQFISFVTKGDDHVTNYIAERSHQKLDQKKPLQVSCQLIIYRKK